MVGAIPSMNLVDLDARLDDGVSPRRHFAVPIPRRTAGDGRSDGSGDSRGAGGKLHDPAGAGAVGGQMAGAGDLCASGRPAAARRTAPSTAWGNPEGADRDPAWHGGRWPGRTSHPAGGRASACRVRPDRPGKDAAGAAGRDLRMCDGTRPTVTDRHATTHRTHRTVTARASP